MDIGYVTFMGAMQIWDISKCGNADTNEFSPMKKTVLGTPKPRGVGIPVAPKTIEVMMLESFLLVEITMTYLSVPTKIMMLVAYLLRI